MAFKKGEPRHPNAGRKPGSLNKVRSAIAKSVGEVCAEIGFDPIKALIVLAARSNREDIKMHAAKELLKYVHPQKRAIEHSGAIDMQLQSIINDLEGKTDEELRQIVEDDNE